MEDTQVDVLEPDFTSLEAAKAHIKAHPADIDMDHWERARYSNGQPSCGTTHCIGGTQLVLHYNVKYFEELPSEIYFRRREDGVDNLCLEIMHLPVSEEYNWLYYRDKWPYYLRMAYSAANTPEQLAGVVCEVIQLYINYKGARPR